MPSSNSNHSRSSSIDSGDNELVKIIHARASGGFLPATQHVSPANSTTTAHSRSTGDPYQEDRHSVRLSPSSLVAKDAAFVIPTVANNISADPKNSNGSSSGQPAHLQGFPGAYAVAVPTPTPTEEEEPQLEEGIGYEEETPPNSAPFEVEDPTRATDATVDVLAVANVVSDEEQDEERALPQAQQVDTQAQLEKEAARKARQNMFRMGRGLVLLAVLVVVVLVVVLVPKSNNHNNNGHAEIVNNNFSSDITDKNRAEYVWNLLPNYTQYTVQSNKYSPQSLAYQWTLRDPNLHTNPDYRIQQRYALATF
jgi:hypothetical protein